KERYPYYEGEIEEFRKTFPLNEIHARILDSMVLDHHSKSKRAVLHILHNGPFESVNFPLGGTEFYCADIIRHTNDVSHWSLVPHKDSYRLTMHLNGLHRVYTVKREVERLIQILTSPVFSITHLHSTSLYTEKEIEAMGKTDNMIVSIHDQRMICPETYCFAKNGRVCTGSECTEWCAYSHDSIEKYRKRSAKILSGARQIICFSESSLSLIKGILKPEAQTKIIPHGIPSALASTDKIYPTLENSPFTVAFIGILPIHKGGLIINELTKRPSLPSGKEVKWHIVGDFSLPEVQDHLAVVHGRYCREALSGILKNINPHVAIFLSLCHETYSITVDEALNVGIPVIVTPYGAPPERVKSHGGGWVLDDLSVKGILNLLDRISSNTKEYIEKQAKASKAPIISLDEEMKRISCIYKENFPFNTKKPVKTLKGFIIEAGGLL
ncbi:MAG: glycosyltransferase, partial [Candidatus Dadabacteria bacterium]